SERSRHLWNREPLQQRLELGKLRIPRGTRGRLRFVDSARFGGGCGFQSQCPRFAERFFTSGNNANEKLWHLGQFCARRLGATRLAAGGRVGRPELRPRSQACFFWLACYAPPSVPLSFGLPRRRITANQNPSRT